MTDQVENQEVELDEGIEEAHDPKNAEQQSVAATDKAGDATKKAPARKGDNSKQDPMPKTKAGLITAMNNRMASMDKTSLMAMYKMEEVEADESSTVVGEAPEVEFSYSNELDALVESEATLSEEFKAKTALIFEAAVKAKLSEEVDRLEEAYKTELAEEIAATKEDLVEKVDSYLNYVVEQWMEDNKLAIQAGLRTEIAEGFMSKMKDLFVESYVEVPESKVDLVDELAQANEELEEAFNDAMSKALKLAEEVESFKRAAIIREASKDLAETQVEKLTSFVENIEFEDEDTFAEKVKIIRETHFAKKTAESVIVEDTEEDTDNSVEISSQMAQYLEALRKSNR
jgi:hypothetical protein